jgi:hypothetical protein
MKRKDVIRGLGAIGAGSVLATSLKIGQSVAQSTPRKANILFLMVDELRTRSRPINIPPNAWITMST